MLSRISDALQGITATGMNRLGALHLGLHFQLCEPVGVRRFDRVCLFSMDIDGSGTPRFQDEYTRSPMLTPTARVVRQHARLTPSSSGKGRTPREPIS